MIFAGDTGGTDTCMTRLLGEASSGTRLRSLLSQPVPCCLDPRCSLSSNVFIEGRNDRLLRGNLVRHSRGSGKVDSHLKCNTWPQKTSAGVW